MKKAGSHGLALLFVTVLFISFLLPMSYAVDYPNKSATFIVAYPAGGRTDMIGRLFTQVFPKYFSQPAVVVNKPGSGTVVGTMEVINANPDGYILGLFSNALVAAHYVLPDTISLWKELIPVAMFNYDPTVFVAAKKTGFKRLSDLISFAKKNPKKLTVGINQGTATSLYTYAFMKASGIEVTYVPFKGGGKAKVALAGGHVDAHFDAPYVYQPIVDAGKAEFMGISSQTRNKYFPNIPTFKEQGIDITWGSWHGIFAPKKTPSEIVQVLERSIEKTVHDKDFETMLTKNKMLLDYRDRQKYTDFLGKEDKLYEEVAIEVGIYKPKK